MCKKFCTFAALKISIEYDKWRGYYIEDRSDIERTLCTLLKFRKVWPEGHHNLDIIAGYCGYDLENHHHALADAEACAWIAREIL